MIKGICGWDLFADRNITFTQTKEDRMSRQTAEQMLLKSTFNY